MSAQPSAGPGLGTMPGRPAGTPVTLKLPPGYTLRAIRGGVTDEFYEACRSVLDDAADFPQPAPPVCVMAFGEYAVTLVLDFDPRQYVPGQDSNRAACAPSGAEPWSGWVLDSVDGRTQNLLVPVFACTATDGTVTPLLALPAPPRAALGGRTTLEFTLSGYCLNHSRHAPEEEDAIAQGVLTSDPGLARILAAIRGKNLSVHASRSAIQDTVWAHTDGEGLTDDDIAALRALS